MLIPSPLGDGPLAGVTRILQSLSYAGGESHFHQTGGYGVPLPVAEQAEHAVSRVEGGGKSNRRRGRDMERALANGNLGVLGDEVSTNDVCEPSRVMSVSINKKVEEHSLKMN